MAAVCGLFRFYPGEWLGLLNNRDHWLRALPRLRLMNPPVRLLSQSKKSFIPWRRGEMVDDLDRELACRHCPARANASMVLARLAFASP